MECYCDSLNPVTVCLTVRKMLRKILLLVAIVLLSIAGELFKSIEIKAGVYSKNNGKLHWSMQIVAPTDSYHAYF
jgi:hypothetical protein